MRNHGFETPCAPTPSARVARRAAAAALVVLTAIGVADAASPMADLAAERAVGVRVLRHEGRPAGRPVGLELHGRGGSLRAVLERNDELVAPGAKVVFVGEDGRREEALRATAWRGKVEGDDESLVRVSIAGGKVRGFVRSGGEVFVIEPDATATDGGHELLSASEVLAAAEPGTCGTEPGEPVTAPIRRAASVARAAGDPLRLLDVSVVADAAYWNRFGEDAPALLQELFNQVDGVYRGELGLAVQIRQMVIYTSAAAQPFVTTGEHAARILTDLALARGADAAGTISAGDVTHLVVGNALDGALGIAWVGGACDPLYGASVSEQTSRPGYLGTVLVAHEMGHNLGAMHDGQPQSECESTPAGCIMWPVLYSSVDDAFSACSAAVIDRWASTATCLEEAIPAGCGDGVLGEGEQCDDGNNLGGDCCRMNCTYELAGMPCPDSGEPCLDNVCDGAGTCATVPNSDPCSSGDACVDARCEDGECVASEDLRGFDTLKVKFRVSDDGMLDACTFVATAPLLDGESDPRSAGLDVRLQVGSTMLYDQHLPPEVWVEKKPGRFTYKAETVMVGRVRQARVNFSQETGQAVYRFTMAHPMLHMAASPPELFLLAGDRADGQCGGDVPSLCGYRGSKYLCE